MAAPRPEHAHATARPATATPLPRPAHTTTGWRQDRRPVVSKRPLHRLAAAKMSPHIHIGPEPVLAAHARSPPAAGSRCPAGADSAPHSEQNFFLMPTPICTTDRDHPVQSDSPVQIKCCFAFSMKSKKWKKEQDPPRLSKSGGSTFALPRSVSCSTWGGQDPRARLQRRP